MPYRGFDTDVCPDPQTLADLKPEFDFLGYYLRAPSHPDQSWLNKRNMLVDLGYGFAPIFVGQETVGPGSHIVTAAQGELDGIAAAQAMHAEGFPPNSTVFLDLENGPPFGQAQADYVSAMIVACRAGGMVAGVYVSHAMAALVAKMHGAAPIWAFRVPTVSRTTAAAPFTAPNPALSGWSAARAWQYRQNVEITVAGHTLTVDLNTATMPDPSAPE